ncbi:MAG: hypothetical protein ACD_15C00216G0001, partial [uncultured bacterium]
EEYLLLGKLGFAKLNNFILIVFFVFVFGERRIFFLSVVII